VIRFAKQRYEQQTGQRLTITCYGKPTPLTYEFAETRLNQLLAQTPYSSLSRIFMIGDNPASDIQGANNRGGIWTSVLVRTGVFQNGTNDSRFPAHCVVEHVGEALDYAFESSGLVEADSCAQIRQEFR
jgi:ribonucleotide monophosphatase NagD (HAD superfamily)